MNFLLFSPRLVYWFQPLRLQVRNTCEIFSDVCELARLWRAGSDFVGNSLRRDVHHVLVGCFAGTCLIESDGLRCTHFILFSPLKNPFPLGNEDPIRVKPFL